MTREEAIKILQQRECCRECVANCTCEQCDEAFEMAYKALEQEPCEDCIFKREWGKIGKLLSVILEKRVEQEQKTDVLDKIRAEQKALININSTTDYSNGVMNCLNIIDKYKAESEEK